MCWQLIYHQHNGCGWGKGWEYLWNNCLAGLSAFVYINIASSAFFWWSGETPGCWPLSSGTKISISGSWGRRRILKSTETKRRKCYEIRVYHTLSKERACSILLFLRTLFLCINGVTTHSTVRGGTKLQTYKNQNTHSRIIVATLDACPRLFCNALTDHTQILALAETLMVYFIWP